ncbi:hypothetical protein SAMN02745784_02932 [Tissierella praeacuta DSM 18095]|uniref:HNH endonuclease n=1 Tax=Tissierella praeacuta DSM 18095 TaxID=1123404 RepID=A0A1M4Z6S6_9FIRM|nr:hypothetical protein [Tissierella praeacuta]SHF13724.1 hypothetical protein SAMN02745784_02932 [Tissierella praeacuta DSM 18095]SUP00577.1 Uncharacterised protein [Tissierella praeacuta]
MNKKPLRPCKKIGCPNLTREGYCEDHIQVAEEHKSIRNKYYDKYVREKKYTDFYNSDEWERVRETILITYHGIDIYAYYINKEIELANTVHHIVEVRYDWDKRLELINLFPTTEKNHTKIHQLYKKDKEGTQRLLMELLERFRREYNIPPSF